MIITQTPLRLSFLGGNTDFRDYYLKYGGFVLTSTIDKYIYCIVKERFDDKIIINYSIKETVDSVNEIQHELVREAMKLVGIEKGIEISFLADIPSSGSGLGSSSAVLVGLLNALHTYAGEHVSSFQLAEEAVRIEVDILEKPIGVQDQFAVAYGGLKTFEFKTNGKIKVKKVALNESVREDFNNSLMLFYTGVTRKTADILSTVNIEDNTELLSRNKYYATKGTQSLETGDLKQFGDYLDAYWQTKKELSGKVSNDKIDEMYRIAREAGAIGGKVVGAGGGGFLLVMFPANKRAIIREALKDYKELPFRFSRTGSKVIFNNL